MEAYLKRLMRSDNQSVCTNKQACDRKAYAFIKVATREMWNLKCEVAIDWQVDCSTGVTSIQYSTELACSMTFRRQN